MFDHKFEPIVVNLAGKFFSFHRELCNLDKSKAPGRLAQVCGTTEENVVETLRNKDVWVAARCWYAYLQKERRPIGASEFNVLLAQRRLLLAGNPHIYIPDHELIGRLSQSRAITTGMDAIAPPLESFVVVVPKDTIIDGCKLRSFFCSFLKEDHGIQVNSEIMFGSARHFFTAPWMVFLEYLSGGKDAIQSSGNTISRHEDKAVHMYMRLAAALCLYILEDPGCLKEGLPPGAMTRDLRYYRPDFRTPSGKALRFDPKILGRGFRKGHLVRGHDMFLVHPRYHQGRTGEVRRVWRNGSQRGVPLQKAYTADPGKSSELTSNP